MRLVTRGNLDGLCSAVLVTEVEQVDSVELIHPQDLTDGRFTPRKGDILVNVPYHPACSKWFDHHAATKTYEKPPESFEGKFGLAPSAARLVYEYYREQKPELDRFQAFVDEVDRFDGATLSIEDVTDPKGYILLGFTLDPRTGLGPFQEYFRSLVDRLKRYPIEGILRQLDVQVRVDRIAQNREAFLAVLKRQSRQVGNVVVTDLRQVAEPPVGNRFLIYTLFPEANVSLRIAFGPDRRFVVATVGHNIFNRTSTVHVGQLMAKYGGGGHQGAGASPLATKEADRLIAQLIRELQGQASAETKT